MSVSQLHDVKRKGLLRDGERRKDRNITEQFSDQLESSLVSNFGGRYKGNNKRLSAEVQFIRG